MVKVVVFAGHDHDTWEKLGAKGVRTDLEKDGVYEEFDTNFLIAKGTVALLKKVKGLTVYFPQADGRKMTLAQRVSYANSIGADLLVDIHSNAAASRTATGAAAFYWHTSKNGKKAANLYSALLKKHGFPLWSDGTYASNPNDGWSEFYMLKHSNMPALLTENFFFTTRSDLEKYLLNPTNQRKLMEITADTVTQYFGKPSAMAVSKPVPVPVVKPAAPSKPKEEVKVTYQKNAQASKSLAPEFNKAVAMGITDGTYPQRPATREEVAVMVLRAAELVKVK